MRSRCTPSALAALLCLAGPLAHAAPSGLATPQPMPEHAASAPLAASSPSAKPGSGTITLDAMVAAARADAARRSGIDEAALELLGAEQVTWRSGALGCPQADRLYTMALVNGYRIRLRAGTQVLDYHAGVRGGLLLCPAGLSETPLPAARI
jgi:hypothetical protein